MNNYSKIDILPETILIVDDNLANIEIAQKILSDYGYEVAFATNADEALNFLHYEKPDLILLDIMMPDVNGFELCQQIKSRSDMTEIPIIFLTALTQPEDLVKGFALGGVDYITKPFSKDVLLTRVRNQIEIVNKNKIIMQQNADLIKLNKEINALLEIAAHDLNNPLQAIIGSIELIEKKLLNTNCEYNPELIDNIKFSSSKAINIIRDLLDVQALEKGKLHIEKSIFDARDIVIESIDEFIVLANKKKINIIYEEDSNDCILNTDKNKLMRIIDNLMSNAVKFSPLNSQINVSCKVVKLNNLEDLVQIIIKDNGPGFTKEDLSKIFSKFSKLSARPTAEESSTGLGLSIVKKMTELLGGIVELETKERKGSTFKISFFKYIKI